MPTPHQGSAVALPQGLTVEDAERIASSFRPSWEGGSPSSDPPPALPARTRSDRPAGRRMSQPPSDASVASAAHAPAARSHVVEPEASVIVDATVETAAVTADGTPPPEVEQGTVPIPLVTPPRAFAPVSPGKMATPAAAGAGPVAMPKRTVVMEGGPVAVAAPVAMPKRTVAMDAAPAFAPAVAAPARPHRPLPPLADVDDERTEVPARRNDTKRIVIGALVVSMLIVVAAITRTLLAPEPDGPTPPRAAATASPPAATAAATESLPVRGAAAEAPAPAAAPAAAAPTPPPEPAAPVEAPPAPPRAAAVAPRPAPAAPAEPPRPRTAPAAPRPAAPRPPPPKAASTGSIVRDAPF